MCNLSAKYCRFGIFFIQMNRIDVTGYLCYALYLFCCCRFTAAIEISGTAEIFEIIAL